MIHDHALVIHYEEYVHQMHIQQTQQRYHLDGVSLYTAYQHVTQYVYSRYNSATTWMVSVCTQHINT